MKKLVGYITAAFPDKNFTIDLAYELNRNGVDTLEIGIPFSDPVADGPVIEKANLLALKNGFKIGSKWLEKLTLPLDKFHCRLA